MPLFIGRMVVTVEIPVAGEDERAALEYLNSTNEWMEDAGFDGADKDKISIVGVERIDTPSQTPAVWDSDCVCWNGSYTEIAIEQELGIAFFSEKLTQIKPEYDEDMPADEFDKVWMEFHDEKMKAIAEFDAARKKTNSY